jgi:hypothetical protein
LGELGVELGLVERDYGRRWRKSMEAEEARVRGGEEQKKRKRKKAKRIGTREEKGGGEKGKG